MHFKLIIYVVFLFILSHQNFIALFPKKNKKVEIKVQSKKEKLAVDLHRTFDTLKKFFRRICH